MWGVFFDVVLLIACLFAFPLLFFLGILYPGGMIIAVLAVPKHHDILMDGLFAIMAFLTCYGTTLIYKRGSYK